ncbi:hemagglutinin/amebocyte aggregation factor-like isoform X1 [Hemiscyllium ocellatum]|uniref:hemagglutinin/amebocyte aggregation factor-like isoform X1 n=2 Tax=Hemiscyllium ocellatum TaxID=170820 RepID=UPI0029666711|nr:hemagglutinin/amebocyte aggregation factor-like isoform X1 [Hemiscyllium ocellatum]
MSPGKVCLLFCVLLARVRAPSEGPEKRWLVDNMSGMSYVCPRGGSISVIVSQFNNKTDERVWDFACKATFRGIINCSWTDYVNNFDEGINFSCPSESLICGVENLRLPKHKDRKWKFYCCGKYTVCYANCAWTDYVNESREYFSWLVPKGFYLVGAVRYHDSNGNKRRWQYRYCAMFPTVLPTL